MHKFAYGSRLLLIRYMCTVCAWEANGAVSGKFREISAPAAPLANFSLNFAKLWDTPKPDPAAPRSTGGSRTHSHARPHPNPGTHASPRTTAHLSHPKLGGGNGAQAREQRGSSSPWRRGPRRSQRSTIAGHADISPRPVKIHRGEPGPVQYSLRCQAAPDDACNFV